MNKKKSDFKAAKVNKYIFNVSTVAILVIRDIVIERKKNEITAIVLNLREKKITKKESHKICLNIVSYELIDKISNDTYTWQN